MAKLNVNDAKSAKLYTLANGFSGEEISVERAKARVSEGYRLCRDLSTEGTIRIDANRWIKVYF